MKSIKLQSSDGEIMEMRVAVAKQSVVINNILEEEEDSSLSSSSSEMESSVVPLPNVRGKVLKKVIEWMKKKQSESESESKSTDEDDEIREWEKRYVDGVDLNFMYELIRAADYLHLSPLLHRCCQKVADMIAGKSPEKIRHTFGIENDFTPQEEAHIRNQSAWIFEPKPDTQSNTNQYFNAPD